MWLNLMMSRLFWKIFLSFWLAMILVGLATAIFSAKIATQRSAHQRDYNYVKTVTLAAKLMLEKGQQEQFNRWAEHLQQRHLLQLYLVRDDAAAIEKQPWPMSAAAFKQQKFIISEPFVNNQGEHYRIIAKLPLIAILPFNFSMRIFLFRFVLFMLVGGVIAYFLSLYLIKPIRALQHASKRLGEGKFETRIDKKLLRRDDEIGDLAVEFDHMAERLQSIVQTQQQLLQDISHEFRSPLARIYVALEIAKDKQAGDIVTELDRIELEINRLNQLIAGVLSFASLDATQDSLSREKIDIDDFIESIVKDANFEWQNRDKSIVFNDKLTIFVNANALLLRSAIENVIRNALRYSPSGQPVEVSLASKDKKVYITVRDYGPGVEQEKIPSLLVPFYRVDGARSAKSGGYGLGLAITHKVIKLYHGSVQINNVAPTGLQVQLVLPAQF